MSQGPSTLVASTLQKLESSRGDADLQLIAFDLMKSATPGEIEALVRSIAAPSPFRNWLRDLHANVTLHVTAAAPFRCDYSSEGVSRYSCGKKARVLIVGFCGKSQLIHGPTAVLLQNFPEAADVLILRDRSRQGFSQGIPDFADGFLAMVDRLRAEFDLNGYEDIKCLGGSGGAAAAFAMGQLLGASKMVSFCGSPPALWQTTPTAATQDLERHIVAGPPGTGRAYAVFGKGHARDTSGAEAFARLLDVALVPVDGVEHHNVIRPLHKRGELPAVLRKVGIL